MPGTAEWLDHPVARQLLVLALLATTFVPLEHVFGSGRSRREGRATDVAFAIAGGLIVRGLLVFVMSPIFLGLDRVAPGRALLRLEDSPLVEIALGLFLYELAGYGYHRLAHAWAPLYRLHAVHHSNTDLDWLSTFRQHPLELFLMTTVQNAPLLLLGLSLGSHLTLVTLLKVSAVFIHADLRVSFGPLRHVVVTPALHHRHHDATLPVRNFATVFPCFDRWFGTFDDAETREAGLPGEAGPSLPTDFVGWLRFPFTDAARRLASGTAQLTTEVPGARRLAVVAGALAVVAARDSVDLVGLAGPGVATGGGAVVTGVAVGAEVAAARGAGVAVPDGLAGAVDAREA